MLSDDMDTTDITDLMCMDVSFLWTTNADTWTQLGCEHVSRFRRIFHITLFYIMHMRIYAWTN